MPKEYPAEFKTKIIKRYQKGESIQSLSQELHIAQSTLYDWRREYCSIKTANRTYTPKEFDTLSRRLEKLEHELEIIRLTGYISNVPLQKKLVFLESLYQKPDNPYSVHELCEALDVARGTFYNHIFRRADRSKRDQEQARLMRLVQQVFDDSAQRFGAEKIRIALAESGIRVSTKRIAAIMQELDLHSIRPDAKKAIQEASAVQKTESTGAAVHRGASQPNLGQRYYILQNQRLLALLLYDPRPFLPQGHRLSDVPQRKHSSGHKHLPGGLSSTRQSHRADLSQRSRRTVYLSHAYGTVAKMRCETVLFRYSTAP